MVFRRRRRLRRRFVRRRVRRARVPRRFLGTAGTRYFKLRLLENVNNNSAVAVPDNSVATNQDWVSIRNLFKYYRVNAIRIHYFPVSNVNAVNAPSSNGFLDPIYVWHDFEVPSDPINLTNALNRENTRYMPSNRPWKLYFRMSKRMVNAPLTTFTTLRNNWQKTALPTATQQISLLAPNIGITGQIGRLQICYYFAACMRA